MLRADAAVSDAACGCSTECDCGGRLSLQPGCRSGWREPLSAPRRTRALNLAAPRQQLNATGTPYPGNRSRPALRGQIAPLIFEDPYPYVQSAGRRDSQRVR